MSAFSATWSWLQEAECLRLAEPMDRSSKSHNEACEELDLRRAIAVPIVVYMGGI